MEIYLMKLSMIPLCMIKFQDRDLKRRNRGVAIVNGCHHTENLELNVKQINKNSIKLVLT